MPDDKINVLTVTLPTNFKAARFDSEASTAIMRQFQREIEAIRFNAGDAQIDLPVKLKVHDSIFVPLAKWAMLCTGNYRCVQAGCGGLDQGGGAHRSRGIRAYIQLGARTLRACWALRRTIWCRSRNMPRQPTG